MEQEDYEGLAKKGFNFLKPLCQGTSATLYLVECFPVAPTCFKDMQHAIHLLHTSASHDNEDALRKEDVEDLAQYHSPSASLHSSKQDVRKSDARKSDARKSDARKSDVSDSQKIARSVPFLLVCKMIDTSTAPKDFVNKFLLRELDIICKIQHPDIVHIHSIYLRNNKYFIFMRNCELGNLCDFLLNFGALKENQAKFWMRQLAAGISYLHALDVAHRDIKCENVLITSNHNVKLGDFGFARFTIDMKGRNVMSNTYCGSVAYAAPELIKGIENDPKKADIWSTGVVLFAMLNRCLPFRSDNLTNLWLSQTNKVYRFRTLVMKRSSKNVLKLVSQMLEPNVGKRITAEGVLQSDWIMSEERYRRLTPDEEATLRNSLKMKIEFRPSLRKAPHLLTRDKHNVLMFRKLTWEESSQKTIQSILVDQLEEEEEEEGEEHPDDEAVWRKSSGSALPSNLSGMDRRSGGGSTASGGKKVGSVSGQ